MEGAWRPLLCAIYLGLQSRVSWSRIWVISEASNLIFIYIIYLGANTGIYTTYLCSSSDRWTSILVPLHISCRSTRSTWRPEPCSDSEQDPVGQGPWGRKTALSGSCRPWKTPLQTHLEVGWGGCGALSFSLCILTGNPYPHTKADIPLEPGHSYLWTLSITITWKDWATCSCVWTSLIENLLITVVCWNQCSLFLSSPSCFYFPTFPN